LIIPTLFPCAEAAMLIAKIPTPMKSPETTFFVIVPSIP
jgi:hypothetical protein